MFNAKEYHRQYRINNKEYFDKYEKERAERRKNCPEWKAKHSAACLKSSKKAWDKDPQKMVWQRAKNASKLSGKEFTISKEDIYIPEHCPLLGTKLETKSTENRSRSNSLSLDRIDSSKGYVPGNVRVISHLANCMKNNATKEQLLTFAKNIPSYFEEDPKSCSPQKISTVISG